MNGDYLSQSFFSLCTAFILARRSFFPADVLNRAGMRRCLRRCWALADAAVASAPCSEVKGGGGIALFRVGGRWAVEDAAAFSSAALQPPPPQNARSRINKGLFTGVLAVDALAPIHAGQALLVHGPPGTGKRTLVRDLLRCADVVFEPSPDAPNPYAAALNAIGEAAAGLDSGKHAVVVVDVSGKAMRLPCSCGKRVLWYGRTSKRYRRKKIGACQLKS